MLFSLDYDKTYTEDPKFWRQFISLAHRYGHKTICVTMRGLDEMDEGLLALSRVIEVYPTSRQAKATYLRTLGMYPDVWLDDNPITIYADHANRVKYIFSGRDYAKVSNKLSEDYLREQVCSST